MIIIIPVLLLALLVVLAGLFLLAKAKKEQLGRTYVIASTVATAFGVLVFVFGITAGILMCCHKACGHGKRNCRSEMSCPIMGGHGGCSKMNDSQSECGMNEGCGGGHGSFHMKMKRKHCEMSNMNCEGGDGVKEVIIKKSGDGENGTEVKVEVDKKPK